MEGVDAEQGTPDARATGGAGGKLDAGRTGGTGGKADAGSGGTGGTLVPDAAAPTGGTSGSGGAPEDAGSGGSSGTGGQGGQGGTGGMTGTGGQGPPDASGSPPTSGTAACHPDPNVIRICKQLEPACQNCASSSTVTRCYALVAAGDDEACVQYAVDNDCKVDQGGNWCGSLNCQAQGCPRTNCLQVQGNGVSGTCQALLDECPCE